MMCHFTQRDRKHVQRIILTHTHLSLRLSFVFIRLNYHRYRDYKWKYRGYILFLPFVRLFSFFNLFPDYQFHHIGFLSSHSPLFSLSFMYKKFDCVQIFHCTVVCVHMHATLGILFPNSYYNTCFVFRLMFNRVCAHLKIKCAVFCFFFLAI